VRYLVVEPEGSGEFTRLIDRDCQGRVFDQTEWIDPGDRSFEREAETLFGVGCEGDASIGE